MKAHEAIERLCALASKVAKIQYKNELPSDCFCDKASPHGRPPVIDDNIVLFIENSVTMTLMGMDGHDTSTLFLTEVEKQEARQYIPNIAASGHRLLAIKAVRQRTGCGLIDAKNAVDAYLKSINKV